MYDSLSNLLEKTSLIPVLTIERLEDCLPLADALQQGGLTVLEITLRSECAWDAINLLKARTDLSIGIGTVLCTKDLQTADAAGVDFIVTPGMTHSMLEESQKLKTPLLPGCATVSEAMVLREYGFKVLKFFPAEAAGGAAYLKSIKGPLPDVRFCPTGGITLDTAADYKSLDNVITIGGSWMVPRELLNVKDFSTIAKLAEQTNDKLQ